MRLENESGITVNLDVSGVWVARFFPSFLPFFLPSLLPSNLPSFFSLTRSPLPVMRRCCSRRVRHDWAAELRWAEACFYDQPTWNGMRHCGRSPPHPRFTSLSSTTVSYYIYFIHISVYCQAFPAGILAPWGLVLILLFTASLPVSQKEWDT